MLIKVEASSQSLRVHKQKCNLKEEPDTNVLSSFRITVKLKIINGIYTVQINEVNVAIPTWTSDYVTTVFMQCKRFSWNQVCFPHVDFWKVLKLPWLFLTPVTISDAVSFEDQGTLLTWTIDVIMSLFLKPVVRVLNVFGHAISMQYYGRVTISCRPFFFFR